MCVCVQVFRCALARGNVIQQHLQQQRRLPQREEDVVARRCSTRMAALAPTRKCVSEYGGDRYIGKKKDLTNGKPASPRKRSTWLSATGRGSKAHRLANYHVHGAELAKHGECPRCDDAKALQLPASGSGLAGSKRPAPDSLSALDSEFGTLLSTFHKSQQVLRPARPEDGGVAVSKGLFLVSRWQSWCLSTR